MCIRDSGKSEDYIKNVLDPMNEQFLAEVKSQRSKLAELDDDAPVLQGERDVYKRQE